MVREAPQSPAPTPSAVPRSGVVYDVVDHAGVVLAVRAVPREARDAAARLGGVVRARRVAPPG